MSWRKRAFVVTLSGMTLMTMSACRWQYNRYQYSVSKWKRLDEQFAQEIPTHTEFSNLPWETSTQSSELSSNEPQIDDIEYKLISIEGELRPHRFLVHRTSEGRPGYLVVAALSPSPHRTTDASKKSIVVNLGWIPAHMKSQFEVENSSSSQPTSLTALIKRPEKVDYINQQSATSKITTGTTPPPLTQNSKLETNQQNTTTQSAGSMKYFNSYIDLALIEDKLKNECPIEKRIYLEKFLISKHTQSQQISGSSNHSDGEADEDLYPVCSSPQTFQRPYLTPDKHQSYCLFWGCCSTFVIPFLRVFIWVHFVCKKRNMKSFFQKSERKYLRKKSALVQDYMLGGMCLVGFGLFANHYNNKLNPQNPEEDIDQTEIVQKLGVMESLQMQLRNKTHAAIGQRKIEELKAKQIQQQIQSEVVRVLVPEKPTGSKID